MLPCALWADIKSIEGVISAKDAKASVVLGDSVRIPLEGILPKNFKPFEFGIIDGPEFGTLSSIARDPGDGARAWVIYTPKPGALAGRDTFRYNAKLEGKKASPSATVELSLLNPVARVRVDPALAFGKVEVGKSRSLPLRITNGGTKGFVATLRVPEPFSIPEAQRAISVDPGGEVIVDVLFSPVGLKPAKHVLTLQPGNPDGSIEIFGEGAPPFEIQVGRLDLDWDEASGTRRGILRLANRTDRQLPLKLIVPLAIELDRVIVLEPREAKDFPVSLSGTATFRDEIVIESEHHQASLALRGRATPVKIRVLKPVDKRRFDFELLNTETPPVYEVVVTNTGGRTAFIYGEASRPFFVKEGRDPTELATGAQMKISVSMDPREVGTYQRTLKILGSANEITFDLHALITRNVDRTQAGVRLPNLEPIMTQQQRELLGLLPSPMQRINNISARNRVILKEIPTVKKLYLEEQGARKLVLSWDHPGSSELDYLLEVEVYEKGERGIPKIVWHQADDPKRVVIEKGDEKVTMTLKKLVPGRQFRLRILTMNKDGHTSKPSRSALVYTLQPKRIKLWLLLPFVAILGGGGFYVWRRRQLR
ncbi:MAG: hypothetical protein ACI8XO_004661 [Verrucomicrobiales bacterium]|jgi:hypothetical protein